MVYTINTIIRGLRGVQGFYILYYIEILYFFLQPIIYNPRIPCNPRPTPPPRTKPRKTATTFENEITRPLFAGRVGWRPCFPWVFRRPWKLSHIFRVIFLYRLVDGSPAGYIGWPTYPLSPIPYTDIPSYYTNMLNLYKSTAACKHR